MTSNMSAVMREHVRDRFAAIDEARDEFADFRIEPGTLSDFRVLERFHYRGGHPGGVTSVLCMRRFGPSVVERFAKRGACRVLAKTRHRGLGPAREVRRGRSELMGVLVRSLPSLACRMRDDATGGRYTNLAPRDTAIMLNREVRTISRVVIDPRYRGLGLAVDLVRYALEHPEPSDPSLRFTEALAAMGRVSPFFERAGMKKYECPPRAEHQRLVDVLHELGLQPETLVCLGQVQEQLKGKSPVVQTWFESELRRWHRAAHRVPKHKVAAQSMNDLLHRARSEMCSQPVYYIYQHGT